MSIRGILGQAFGGPPLDWTAVGKHLRDRYIENPEEKTRRAEAKKRDEYYEGQGDRHIVALIEVAYQDAKNRRLRSDLVSRAKWNNVIKRVAHETATVYGDAPTRRIDGDGEKYKAFLEIVGQDAAMRELDRKLVYHEDVWVQYRVRGVEPVIDVISPSVFWAVNDPRDSTHLIAIVIDESSGASSKYHPHYRVLTAFETFMLNGDCVVMPSTVIDHGLKRLPGVLVSTRPKSRLLACTPAADLVAAHESVWFENVLLLKESKSATKQLAVTGDTTRAAVGQTSDTETEFVLPEGVTTTSIDRGMDLRQFRDNVDHILERAAANYGLPPSVLHHRDSSSGQEISLRRIPLRELRKQRIPIMRNVERQLAEIQSVVNASVLSVYSFAIDGWGIDFAEVEQPLTEAEQDAVFEKRRQLGLTDTIEEIRRRNPDLRSDEEAEAVLKLHIAVETMRVLLMKALMAANGSAGSETGEPTPEDNGSEGRFAARGAA